jgi:hypothetical protein
MKASLFLIIAHAQLPELRRKIIDDLQFMMLYVSTELQYQSQVRPLTAYCYPSVFPSTSWKSACFLCVLSFHSTFDDTVLLSQISYDSSASPPVIQSTHVAKSMERTRVHRDHITAGRLLVANLHIRGSDTLCGRISLRSCSPTLPDYRTSFLPFPPST